jgi:hypothetical protein
VVWQNDDMVLYHGCSDGSLFPNDRNGIVVTGAAHNISPTARATRPDLGKGFYTTTWLHQAKNRANLRVEKLSRTENISLRSDGKADRDAWSLHTSTWRPNSVNGSYHD